MMLPFDIDMTLQWPAVVVMYKTNVSQLYKEWMSVMMKHKDVTTPNVAMYLSTHVLT